MQFRRFNEAGVQAFRDYLHRLRSEPTLPPPRTLLEDASVSEPLTPPIAAEPEDFENRMAFARWLYEAAEAAGTTVPRTDPGFWAWLSLALFDQVCPANQKGQRSVREDAWYIPAIGDPRRHYRHCLFGTYSVFHLHQDNPERAQILLCGNLNTLGHFYYQIASRQDLLSNPNIMAATTRLYLDGQSGRPKRGSVSNRNGSVFRFVKMLNQFDRVWDLAVTEPSQILAMLPSEFDRFRFNQMSVHVGRDVRDDMLVHSDRA